MVKVGNHWYFFFIALAVGLVVGLYYLFRNKSLNSKKWLIFGLLLFNFALHFLKLLHPHYSSNPNFAMESAWCVNICAVSVITFPFLFLSKSETAKDWMFYIGVISGFLALLYPTEAIGKSMLYVELWRFYICHMILIIAPLLMVLLGVHKLNYKNVWKMPFCMIAVMMFIIVNQVLLSELGYIDLRGVNLLEEGCGYRNTSLIWGPTDGIASLFTWATPNFMKVVPFGELAGQEKYWPLFYLMPAIFIYFITIPFLLCLIWQRKEIVSDFKILLSKFKKKKQ